MKKLIIVLSLVLVCIASCASTGTVYKYYVIDPAENKLLAAKEKDDLPLDKTCDPDSKDKAKCIAMMTAEFFEMKKELMELRKAVSECQKGPKP